MPAGSPPWCSRSAPALRLARFNVMIDDPNKPAWAGNFFVGMPAPAGAITVLLPIYVYFLGMPRLAFVAPVTLVYTLAIAFLMVSRLPVFSGKRVGKRVAPEMVLPVFVAVVLFFALLVSYPWIVLTIGTVLYLASLPLGWLSYRRHERKDAATASAAPASPDARPRPQGEERHRSRPVTRPASPSAHPAELSRRRAAPKRFQHWRPPHSSIHWQWPIDFPQNCGPTAARLHCQNVHLFIRSRPPPGGTSPRMPRGRRP